MAARTPIEKYAEALDGLSEAKRLPLGSAARNDALAVAQVNATLAVADLLTQVVAPVRFVMPDDVDPAVVAAALTHPPVVTQPKARRTRTAPKAADQ